MEYMVWYKLMDAQLLEVRDLLEGAFRFGAGAGAEQIISYSQISPGAPPDTTRRLNVLLSLAPSSFSLPPPS